MTSVLRLKAKLPTPLTALADLAYNYWWIWTEERVSLFSVLDPVRWQACNYNPVALLEAVSDERLWQVAEDPHYLNRLRQLTHEFETYCRDGSKGVALDPGKPWASPGASQLSLDRPVAYFCIEFGLHESLPVYAGGLGVLAGDSLKSASDLGVPMVGVGLLYRQGYFHQHLNRSGWQEEHYTHCEVNHLPMELVRDEFGQPVTVKLDIRQRTVRVQVWRVQVGRSQLYLLDTDRSDNDSLDRRITSHLYGGNAETRLAQALVLGIGGVRMLHALDIEPMVYHLNASHGAFALLEVTHREMRHSDGDFDAIADRVRQHSVFTTHSPVSAASNVFSADLIESFLGGYWPQLGLSREDFLALGNRRPDDPWDLFSMTVLALRLSGKANGVSQRHGELCREMWQALYPDCALSEVPIGSITNGVHARTWTAPLMMDLYRQHLGEDWSTKIADPDLWAGVEQIPDEQLWQRHRLLKERLIAYTRSRVRAARHSRGEATDEIAAVDRLLDPAVLTLGFGRRFSPYKRGELLFSDLHRAIRILAHSRRPIQIIFAGKANPADEEGKRIIQRLMEWCRHPALRDRVAFIEDYDMAVAKLLVAGVDLWLNHPRRPEASGTSGQKVALNGGLNCGTLDGWWTEGYQPGGAGRAANGWVIGKANPTEDPDSQNHQDADSLYDLLEHQIAPLYYQRDGEGAGGLPRQWIAMMKASIRSCAPYYNSDRMVAEYFTQMYAPSAAPAAFSATL
ncbi:alpha-glucan family phosphorylase [Nodosilinea sp. E11]|uniref:alpha-glucan family phosphorylase n=1 Tax=Nodosilinea sp. E11 TaxID=3037479 RepID=UPI00293461C8|nr:alpha-glucan family phosphorylase [Nodosilinea sp. E11]WOD38934.1 alpha-glucan family phosphorylase [Nodosilinea sp. E11]